MAHLTDGTDDLDLDGVSQEDAELIRHLTWLYGGYSRRKRTSTSPFQISSNSVLLKCETKTSPVKTSSPASPKIRKKPAVVPIPKALKKNRKSNGTGGNLADPKNEKKGKLETKRLKAESPESSSESDADSLDLDLNQAEKIALGDRRRPRWPLEYSLEDKIGNFLHRKIATRTDTRQGQGPDTLTICKQFALDNHEAMVADVDRIHYYRAAIYWTGFGDVRTAANSLGAAGTTPTGASATGLKSPRRLAEDSIEESSSTSLLDSVVNTPIVEVANAPQEEYYVTHKRILEIGTGPLCVLAMNAFRAGALSVDALEVCESSARLASRLMAAYGCADKIRVHKCHSKVFTNSNFLKSQPLVDGHFKLPPRPPYDMVISEILGDFASQEGVADVFLDFQQRVLYNHPDYLRQVVSIPKAACTAFIPCTFPDHDNVLFKAKKYREMTIFTPRLKMFQSVGLRIDNLPLAEDWGLLEHLEFQQWMEPQMCQHYECMFKINEDGNQCGFLVGIDVEIRPGEHFGTRFGHCQSWYTNILLLNKDYKVSAGFIVVVRSIANLTNYTRSGLGGYKIWASRPCYTLRAYILSPVVAPQDETSYRFYSYLDFVHCRRLNCNFCSVEIPRNVKGVVPATSVDSKDVEPRNCNCNEPEDWLQGFKYVKIKENWYRIEHRPPILSLDYSEQNSVIYTNGD